MSRFSAFSRCLPLVNPIDPPPPPPPPPGGKKFNTGYYWAPLYGSNGPGGMHDYTGLINDLRNIPNIMGCLIRVNWHELETSQGVYDWSVINQVYNAVSTLPTPKRLCVLIEFRSNGSPGGGVPAQNVPSYVYNNPTTYGGGAGNGGTWLATGGAADRPFDIRYMRLWNAPLLARLKALSDAFAAEFDNKPYFEMLQFSEPIVATPNSSTGANAGIPTGISTSYPDGIKNWVLYTNTKFTKTIVTQLCNYPASLNTTYIPSLRDAGVGVSCPNSLKDEPGLWVNGTNKGIWQWFRRTDAAKLQGVSVIAPHIQKPECYYSNLSGNNDGGVDGLGTFPGASATPPYGANGAEEIVDLLKSVGANYAFVTRAPQETDTQQFGRNNQNAIDIPAWQAYFQRPLAQIALNSTRPSNLP